MPSLSIHFKMYYLMFKHNKIASYNTATHLGCRILVVNTNEIQILCGNFVIGSALLKDNALFTCI